MRGNKLLFLVLLSFGLSLALPPSALYANAPQEEEEVTEQTVRSFIYKELVLSGFFAAMGVSGVPPHDMERDYFELTHRPPGNYIGLDYVALIEPGSRTRIPLTGINLHPRLVLDRFEKKKGLHKLRFAPQDFWLRFSPGQVDRFTVRVGQFVIPYGVNPIVAPRQRFILPLEATDLGLKWDWGISAKGPLKALDWEVAATIGTGESLHDPRLFQDSDSTSYLYTGRIGTPTYLDHQVGVSFLYGKLPMIRGAHIFSPTAISRWRVGLDGFYKRGTYLMLGGQVTVGQDGFNGDKNLMMMTMGEPATVVGFRAMVDWVSPKNQDLRLAGQFESVVRDVSTSGSDDTALILELTYSLTTSLSMVLDHRWEMNTSMGEKNSAVYLTFVYYSR